MTCISALSKSALICLLVNVLHLQTAFAQSYASPDQLNASVYDDRLTAYDFDSLVKATPNVVCVIGMSCGGCVEYFAEQKITGTFVYFVEDLSIMEMTRTRFQGNRSDLKFYYTLRIPEADKLFSARSPQMLINRNGTVRLIDYDTLSRLTRGFTLPKKKILKELEKS